MTPFLSAAPCLLPPPLLPICNIGSPPCFLPTPSSFIHEYFNMHQNDGIASTYNVAKAKDSWCYLHCIPDKISHHTELSRRTRGDQQDARCSGWLACGSAWTVSPGSWDSVPHCGHYWPIPAGGYLALCSEVVKFLRPSLICRIEIYYCICPICMWWQFAAHVLIKCACMHFGQMFVSQWWICVSGRRAKYSFMRTLY